MKQLIAHKISTPVGEIALAACGGKLCVCDFDCGGFATLSRVAKRLGAQVEWGSSPVIQLAAEELSEYFQRQRRTFTVPLQLCGTEFQQAAWTAMLRVPYGKTASYAEEARMAGRPRALRAIGQANGCNPLAIFVPCHRIVASDGTIGGYSGGLSRKRFLLRLESGVDELFPDE